MALVLNEEQILLRDTTRSFLTERAPVSHLRAIRDKSHSDGFSRELWNEMVEMGWPAILVPEAYGGLEYGFTGLGIVLEETGRTLTPSPLLSTSLTGVAALTLAGTDEQCAQLLPQAAGGELLLSLACDETSRHQPDRVECRLESGDGFLTLSGVKTAVHDGHVADRFIVSAQSAEGITLAVVSSDLPGVTVEPYPSLDISRAANVQFDNVRIEESDLLGRPGTGAEILDQVLNASRIGAAAEMLGLATEAFERTLDYLRERKQFGVPIGSFQALQHRASELFGELELSRSVLIKALHALDEDLTQCDEIASLAKAKISQTAHLATTEAIQMHGGIGMTDDFDIGFFLKRWRILDALYGDRHYHLDRFARCRGY